MLQTPIAVDVRAAGGAPPAPSSKQPTSEHREEGNVGPPPKVPKTSMGPGADFSRNMLPRDALVLKEKLGEGACGIVSMGRCVMGVCMLYDLYRTLNIAHTVGACRVRGLARVLGVCRDACTQH